MIRHLFQIQYNGTAYFGWQRQPKQISVQERIECQLRRLYNRDDIEITGCGRTDTGVHAWQSWFHTDLPDLYDCPTLLFKLNRMLPDDIAIKSIQHVAPTFHARFDAISRSYRYFIHQDKDAFQQDRSLYFPQKLDLDRMNEACLLLLGQKDFTSFSKLHTDVKTNMCTVSRAQWVWLAGNSLYFEVTADRFLRNMVRAMVGTLMDVGVGKLSVADVQRILEEQNRCEASVSVPAHGLYLWEVVYPEAG